jgi:hypothetical protein
VNRPPDPHDVLQAAKAALQKASVNLTYDHLDQYGVLVSAEITDELGHAVTHVVTVSIRIDVRPRR